MTDAMSSSGRARNAGRIIAVLRQWPDLDDDELSQRAGVTPRQQVNMVCRRLESRGILKRFVGPSGKLVNRLTGVQAASAVTHPPKGNSRPMRISAPFVGTAAQPRLGPISLGADVDDVLVILPCSGYKCEGQDGAGVQATLLDELPQTLASRLATARSAFAGIAGLNESTLMPAWRRYAGALYQSAHQGLVREQHSPWPRTCLILSGGYGVVRAIDPIGMYNLRMNESLWPRRLLQEVIEAYARRHRFGRTLALVSGSTDYAKVIRKIDWGQAGISDVLLLTPETSTGALVKAPRAIGEALTTMISGAWADSWASSDGLRMLADRLR